MLEQANSIVQQQRDKVQDALVRWRRSSGGGSSSKRPSSPGTAASPTHKNSTAVDAAVAAASRAESKLQLAQLQHEQQQLLDELGSLSMSSSSERSLGQPHSSSLMRASSQAMSVAASAEAGPAAAAAAAASPRLTASAMPEEVTAYVNSLAARLMSMQALTEHITAEVLAKHQEAVALQASFMKVGPDERTRWQKKGTNKMSRLYGSITRWPAEQLRGGFCVHAGPIL